MPKDVINDIRSGFHAALRGARRSNRRRQPAVGSARRKAASLGAAALAISLLAFCSIAGALDLTGGPSDTPPGGGGCTASGTLARGTGLTLSCTVTSPANFVDLYFGVANNGVANGVAMDGTAPSSFEIFRYSSSTPSSITYTSTTTVDDVLGSSAEDVNTRLVLTLTSGTATVVDTGGTPANNGSGDIGKLFRIAGGSFSVHVDVDSNTLGIPIFGASNTNVYDAVHGPSSGGGGSITQLTLGFYYNECNP